MRVDGAFGEMRESVARLKSGATGGNKIEPGKTGMGPRRRSEEAAQPGRLLGIGQCVRFHPVGRTHRLGPPNAGCQEA